MGLDISFFYMELQKHKLHGVYYITNGMKIYTQYGLDVAVFISCDNRHTCLVQRYYGVYSVAEV